MKSQKIDKYFLANLIANTVNSKIKTKGYLMEELNFFNVLNRINKYEKKEDSDIVKLIIYVIEQQNMFNESEKNTIINDILDKIKYLILA